MWNRPFLMVVFPTIFLILGRMALGCSRNASKESMMLITGCNRCTKHPRNIRSWLQEGDLLIQEHLVFLTFQILFFYRFSFFCPPFYLVNFGYRMGWRIPPGFVHQVYVSLWGGAGTFARWSSKSSWQVCQAAGRAGRAGSFAFCPWLMIFW